MKPAQTISRTVSRTSPPGGGEPHLFLTLRCDRPIEPGARFYLHDANVVTSAPLRDGALLELGHSFLLYREALPAAGPELLDARELRPAAPGLATLSPRLAADLGHLELVARSRVSILIRGETG